MKTVAIIGAGITGLTAAFRLRRENIPVTIYESGARVGGVIQTVRENGYLAEFGPNTILETSPKIDELVHDLRLETRRCETNPAANKHYIIRDGKLVCLPKSPLGFLTTRLFSTRGKLRVMCEPFIRRSQETDENLQQFVLRRLGREFLDYAINPFVAGVFAGNLARLSVQHAFPKLHETEQRYGSLVLGQILGARTRKRNGEISKQEAKKFSFDHGLQVLTDALFAELAHLVQLRTAVVKVRQGFNGWMVTSTCNGNEFEHEHGAVVFAAPAHRIAGIALENKSEISLASLREIEHPPVASVVLGFRQEDVPHPLNGFGFLVPEIERFSILGTTFSSSILPNRAPAGHVTLTSFIGGCRNPELALRDAETLIDLTRADLRRVLGITAKPMFAHHALFSKAIPQYNVGFARFKQLMDDAETKLPGVFFAGTYRDGISLGSAIVSGDNVATRIRNFIESQHPSSIAA